MSKGLMRISSAIEVSANAAINWRKQYEHWQDDDTFFDGTTKKETNDKLNTNRHTPENITDILNKGWAYPSCKCCGEYCDHVVVFKEEFEDDDRISLCKECITKANNIINQL